MFFGTRHTANLPWTQLCAPWPGSIHPEQSWLGNAPPFEVAVACWRAVAVVALRQGPAAHVNPAVRFAQPAGRMQGSAASR